MLRYDVCSLWREFLLFRFQNFSSMPYGGHGVHFESSGGPLAVSRVAFLKLWGCLGLHFSTFGCVLGCIFEALGALWAPFWPNWWPRDLHFSNLGCLLGCILVALGVLWGPSRPNWWPLGRIGGSNAPPAAQNPIFLIFPSLFESILDHFFWLKSIKKSMKN